MWKNMTAVMAAAAVAVLGGCSGISTAKLVTNMPADVTVDGQYLGKAPVSIPVPWRNIDSVIHFAQRKVTVTVEGTVVWEKEISSTIYQKSQTGDFENGSKYGTGRTYTITVDVRAATKPAPTAGM